MRTAVRTLVAILLGLAVTFVAAIAVELVSSVVHPFPEEFGGTPEDMARHVERYPPWFLAAVVPAWAAAAFAGAWTARRIGNVPSSAIVAMLVLAALACNLSMLPYPAWFKAACLLAVPAAALAGLAAARKGPPGKEERTGPAAG